MSNFLTLLVIINRIKKRSNFISLFVITAISFAILSPAKVFGEENRKSTLANVQNECYLDTLYQQEDFRTAQESIVFFERCLDFFRATSRQSPRIRRQIEAYLLRSIGNARASIGENRIALDLYMRSLEISEDVEDFSQVAYSLRDLGNISVVIGEIDSAADYYERSLDIAQELEDKTHLLYSLRDLGRLYSLTGNYQESIKYYEESLRISRNIDDLEQVAYSLRDLGNLHASRGLYSTALPYYEESLILSQGLNDIEQVAYSLRDIGNAYFFLNDYTSALSYYEKSLAISRDFEKSLHIAYSLRDIGKLYVAQEEYNLAIQSYMDSLEVSEYARDSQSILKSLRDLGRVYRLIGEFDEAERFYRRAQEVSENMSSQTDMAISQKDFGYLFELQGQYENALESFLSALHTFESVRQYEEMAYVFRDIARIHEAQEANEQAKAAYEDALILSIILNSPLQKLYSYQDLGYFYFRNGNFQKAITFWRYSLEFHEIIRLQVWGLTQEARKSYHDRMRYFYEDFASLLFSQGLSLEAQEVLNLLRTQQVDEYLRGTERTVSVSRSLVSTNFENKVRDQLRFEERDGQPDQIFRHFSSRPDVQNWLSELQESSLGEANSPEGLALLSKQLDYFSGNVALLSNFSFNDRLEIFVTTANGQAANVAVDITHQELLDLVLEFREDLSYTTSDPIPRAQKLYELLVEPLEDIFEEAGIDAIVYAPNGILSYIPLSALHDGDHWVAERYPVNQITALSLMVARDPLPLEDISVLAAAFTVNGDSHRFNIGERSYEFHGLPYAGAEIDAILARFPNTTTLRDDDFSQDAIVEKMSEHNVLHLATHAEFLPDSPEDSFILFGNGDRANFIDLKNWNLSNTDIVILSACETGIGGVLGDGSEMLGFGYLMQEAGARVSISSLWNIDDGGTERFMGEFYAALQASGVTRAEALRRAQVALIGSGSAVVESSVGSCELDVCFDDGAVVRSGYSHPYYWAPFVLIGDGL